MKIKYILFIFISTALSSCSSRWNDIVHEEVVATVSAFAVQDQAKCQIDPYNNSIALTLPYDADPSAVTVTEFSITEGAKCEPPIKVGDKIDVSSPLTLTLTTYDDYVWTVTATLKPKPVSDIYNMTFDLWDKDFLQMDVPYGSEADSDQRLVWGSAYFYMALGTAGGAIVAKESDLVAVPGEGKAALKLESLYAEGISVFGAGTTFTGLLNSFDGTSFNVALGVPFKKRPVTMDGFALYKPKTIDVASDAYSDKKGTLDNAFVFIALADWDSQYVVDPPSKIMDDTGNIPGIIGYGKLVLDKEMESYEKFSITLNYLNDKTPTYAVILASSSALGDYQTGAAGSILYLDELGFTY